MVNCDDNSCHPSIRNKNASCQSSFKGTRVFNTKKIYIFWSYFGIFMSSLTTQILSNALHLFHGSSGSVGSKAQAGQPGSGVYGSSVAPVVSQGSSSFSHSAASTTTAPYSTDTSTDYSQYNQAYPQVLQRNTDPLTHRNAKIC